MGDKMSEVTPTLNTFIISSSQVVDGGTARFENFSVWAAHHHQAPNAGDS